MKKTVYVKLSCFAPSFHMTIDVPLGNDAEEYIDEFLEAILNDEYRYNCEWDFV